MRKEGAQAFDQRLKQATPLSQFFFDEMSREINLHTLDGKARLAERAKPMLAQIPEGAFGDLMKQELSRLTGVGATSATQASAPQGRPPARMGAPTQKRSLVRASIAILLQRPSLAMSLEGDQDFPACACPASTC